MLLIMLSYMVILFSPHFKRYLDLTSSKEEIFGLIAALQTVFFQLILTLNCGLKLQPLQLVICTSMTMKWIVKIPQPSLNLDLFLNSDSNPNPHSLLINGS